MDWDSFQQQILANEQSRKLGETNGQLQLAVNKQFQDTMHPGTAAWSRALQDAYSQSNQYGMAKYKADQDAEMARMQMELDRHKFDTQNPYYRFDSRSALGQSLLGE